MLRLLKKVLLYFYFIFVRTTKREWLIKLLTGTLDKRKIDIPAIPTDLDKVQTIPEQWQDSISFVGFDSNGVCVKIKAQKRDDGKQQLEADFDIPGFGRYRYKEIAITKCDHYMGYMFGGRRLKIDCQDPMKKWRIYFRGPLMHVNENGERIHAIVSLHWLCLFDPYDFLLSPSCWQLAENLSYLKLEDIFQSSFFDNMVSYEQWGELRGSIEVETKENLEIKLKCVRSRSFTAQNTSYLTSTSHQHFVVMESGLSFSNHSLKRGSRFIHSGYVSFPIGDKIPTFLRSRTGYSATSSLTLVDLMSAERLQFHLSENLTRDCLGSEISEFKFTTCLINGKQAFGVFYDCNDHQSLDEKDADISTGITDFDVANYDLIGSSAAIVNLGTKACMVKSLVGGKAYHLSVLKSCSNFNIPNGYCITTLALENHITLNNQLNEAIQKIKQCPINSKENLLEQQCDDAVRLFKQTPMNHDLQEQAREWLGKIFGEDKWQNMKFAIRSSSVSEDTRDSSMAGQMDTYLCIQEFDNIVSAIQHCWASSVSYKVVEYHRQNGQELFEGLGVVVQEMVDADVAGVLFTADPVSGNETNIMINASYGLGESVVSGKVIPDIITVSREDNVQLQIRELHIGSKETKVVAADINGTAQKLVPNSERNETCLSDEETVYLSKLAIEIEKKFGFPQDIEWAISNRELYILQSRPLSITNSETDEELIHEFDSPIVNEKVFFTPCNVQEMMPGVMSTLTGDLYIRATNRAILNNVNSRLGIQLPVHTAVSTINHTGQVLLNLTPWCVKLISGLLGEAAKTFAEVNATGESVDEHTIEAIKDFYGRNISIKNKVKQVILEFLLSKSDLSLYKRLSNEIENTSFVKHTDTPMELYKWIDEHLVIYFDMWSSYIFMLSGSTGAYAALMLILKGKGNKVTVEHLADITLILAECNDVISAEVPRFINDLAKEISHSEFKEEFLCLAHEECDSFLRNSTNDKIRSHYIHFMERHGHRGVQESEFMDKSWSQDPSHLMKSVQLIVKEGCTDEREKRCLSVNKIVDSLQTKLNIFQKLMLKLYFVKYAMKEIRVRELAKSRLIKATEVIRQAYWKLADIMLKESRLPDQELLFFLTHAEIGELIKYRSTKLVRLSKRRKRVYPEMNKFKYPKVNIGQPLTEQEERSDTINIAENTYEGVPVCRGIAEGRACVIESINDAGQLLQGDVLITRFTDVGWSPFYPLISGLAIEMGSLLSHGAIIAREYGVPCVAGLTGISGIIQTGDHVILDGAAGTITKL